MVRTQVYLTEEQHLALRHAAERQGVSMAALLRNLVDNYLGDNTRKRDYSKDAIEAFIGLGRSDRSDISENHDEVMAEAFRDGTIR